jgi:signal transduction histidine kinase
MLRAPLGDPTLELRFWDVQAGDWDAPVDPRPGSVATTVDRNHKPSVMLIHDAQLDEDPELLQAAGAIALLAEENAELDTEWRAALNDLRRSRARIVHAVDSERQRLAINLHDGVQQMLGALRLKAAVTARATDDVTARSGLEAIGDGLEEAVGQVRAVSHQLYPPLLVERGLVTAIKDAVEPLPVEHSEIGRHTPQIESAVYYCVLEAVQNATKHGGPAVSVFVRLDEGGDALTFQVTDDGPGFDIAAEHDGMGLQNLRDRLSALGGRLAISSVPGRTTVSGSVPLPSASVGVGLDRAVVALEKDT